MYFVNPWILVIGLAAALLPVLIHWLTRPRPVVRPFSTIRFILQAVQQRRARRRLRDFLILAVRTLAVMLLAAAIARPLFGRRPQAPEASDGLTARVVLLDVSQSMAARTEGIQAIERARPVAAAYLSFRPGLVANLLLAGATTHSVFDRPSSNFAALRDELGKAWPRPERLNVQAALAEAARMLAPPAGEGPKRRARRSELVIISDFQRSVWSAADFSVFSPDTEIHLEFAGAAQPPPNAAVLRVGSSGRAEVGRPLAVEVDIGNFSTAQRTLDVDLILPSASYRLGGVCAPGVKTTLTAEIVPRVAGWQIGRAALVGMNDALAEDDSRSFVVDVRKPPNFALVSREGSEVRPSSSYYLERAIVPAGREGDRDRAGPRVVRFDPEHDDREILASADLIALDHPGQLSDATIIALAGWLRRGRPVLYVACEPADATNLKRLADAAGADLRLPVEFAPAPDRGTRAARFIADFRRDGPPFQIFGDAALATLAPLRFSGGLISRPLEGGLADDIKASLDDRSAWLVVSSCGAGSLAILSADLGASNLPASPAFVPLIGELSNLLLGRRSIGPPVACGEPFALPLSADAGPTAGLAIVLDRDSTNQSRGMRTDADPGTELVEEPEGVVCRGRSAPAPGAIRIRRGERTVFALATATPEQESDLAALPANVLQNRLAGDRSVTYRDASRVDEATDSLWSWLALGCAITLALESMLLWVFRS